MEQIEAGTAESFELSHELMQPLSISGPQQTAPGGYQPLSCTAPCAEGFELLAPGDGPSIFAPRRRPQKYCVFGEFLFLHPTGVDMVHARVQNPYFGPANPTPHRVGTTDPHHEPGVRVGGEMALNATASLAASFTYFESNAVSSLKPDSFPQRGEAVESLVHAPPGLIPTPGQYNRPMVFYGVPSTSQRVSARSVLSFQLADIDYRRRLRHDSSYWVNGSVGLRFGHLKQEFGQVGVFDGRGADWFDDDYYVGNSLWYANYLALSQTIITQADADFAGGGVKLAIDGGRNIGTRGFSLYGRAGVSPLAGEFQAKYSMAKADGTQLVWVDWNDDRIVTLLDYEMGIAYSGPRRRWRLSTGYTATHWFNAVTPGTLVNSVQAGDYVDGSETISFTGLTARVERLW